MAAWVSCCAYQARAFLARLYLSTVMNVFQVLTFARCRADTSAHECVDRIYTPCEREGCAQRARRGHGGERPRPSRTGLERVNSLTV
jgi:hypothetical protein